MGLVAGETGSCSGVGTAVDWALTRANCGAWALKTSVSTSARFCSRWN